MMSYENLNHHVGEDPPFSPSQLIQNNNNNQTNHRTHGESRGLSDGASNSGITPAASLLPLLPRPTAPLLARLHLRFGLVLQGPLQSDRAHGRAVQALGYEQLAEGAAAHGFKTADGSALEDN